MFYTYIIRSISHPEQRYIGSTSDLKSRLAIRRFFLLAKNKRSATERAKDALHSSQSDGGLYGTLYPAQGLQALKFWRKKELRLKVVQLNGSPVHGTDRSTTRRTNFSKCKLMIPAPNPTPDE